MATKSGDKGRYICKVGYYDIYAKDTLKPRKESSSKFKKGQTQTTDYVIIHAKKTIEKGLKTKDLAVAKAIELLGSKAVLYSL